MLFDAGLDLVFVGVVLWVGGWVTGLVARKRALPLRLRHAGVVLLFVGAALEILGRI
jgi:hypothetical protein